ncbi:MAG: phosphatidylserine/phosphatidylglycerophosphate/cardiolipin synthase family protein [Planctomycetes bacterium]|nr:phosphatidylserine/phosphatidylglycerophosphate/cardiolipin synthase family protein [Planctomycetota bacterium]
MSEPRLIQSYDGAVEAIQAEIDSSQAGDWIRLSVWILEPGETSEAVLAGLQAAADRGAQVEVSVDGTNASLVQRLWERTVTLLPRVRKIAAAVENFTCVERTKPDHSKYAIFRRKEGPTVAIWGGINMGDRFRPWRDFVVRLEGPLAEEVATKIQGEGEPFVYPPKPDTLTLVASIPSEDQFEILPAFEALMQDPEVTRLRFAMAYIDRTGIEKVLRLALDRGVRVEFMLPKLANVYQDSNLMALEALLPDENFHAVACPHMLHAKVTLAYGADGLRTIFFGSANLKRYSLLYLGELNAFVNHPALMKTLEDAVNALYEESEPITEAPRYWRLKAVVEERLG